MTGDRGETEMDIALYIKSVWYYTANLDKSMLQSVIISTKTDGTIATCPMHLVLMSKEVVNSRYLQNLPFLTTWVCDISR